MSWILLISLKLKEFVILQLPSSSDLPEVCATKTMPSTVCALLYDSEDCDGWEYEVAIGYSELPRFSFLGPRKNDADSVLVRPGCKFIGKKESRD